MQTQAESQQGLAVQDPRIRKNPSILLPGLFFIGVLIILALTRPTEKFEGYVSIALEANGRANYGRDPFNLSFVPIDADILDAVNLPGMQPDGSATTSNSPSPTSTLIPPTPTVVATEPIPTLPLPTSPLPSLLPTDPLEIIPTLISLQPILP